MLRRVSGTSGSAAPSNLLLGKAKSVTRVGWERQRAGAGMLWSEPDCFLSQGYSLQPVNDSGLFVQ